MSLIEGVLNINHHVIWFWLAKNEIAKLFEIFLWNECLLQCTSTV